MSIRYLVRWATAMAMGGLLASPALAETYVKRTFEKLKLSEKFYSEGACIADVNHDGVGDLVAGPYWYAGPELKERSEFYPAKEFDINGYSDNFLSFADDFNGDGWDDVLVVGFPGAEAFWYENPKGKAGHWEKHLAFATVENESPDYLDVTGDGQRELVCCANGTIGFAEWSKEKPRAPWRFRSITPKGDYQRFTHGLGVGDVNGDGRMDILEKNGWWEQPAGESANGTWTFHEVKFSEPGGAQMFAYDVDGDGDNDVITSKAAHAYGLAWFEQVKEGEKIAFREHLVMGEKPEQNDYGVAFSQLHALALEDMDDDGVKDIVTGKRYWAHMGHDPGERDPVLLYWFKTVRDEDGVRFIPHLVADDVGVGTQVTVGDINDDKLPDIVVGSKKGQFALIHRAAEVSEEEWRNSQPKRRGEDGAASAAPEQSTDPARGVAARSREGRELNLGFEQGSLDDWTAEGDAFDGQPVRGDVVRRRRDDMVSGHEGEYWVGTYEGRGDGAHGVLTSVSFPVSHPWASFLVGGGAGSALGVEIVRKDTGDVVFRASGRNSEVMQRVAVDLRELGGKEIFIRVLDHGRAGWGHTNFDDFRFHEEKPQIADSNSVASGAGAPDGYPYAGLPAEDAARVMELPEGFTVTVSAAEPEVKQPIAMAYDDRGRLWVAEAYEYPVRAPEGEGRDRILIFEDADGDGRFDSRKVYAEGLNLVSGLEVGFGGAWVGAAPYLMFLPDADGNDRWDGEAEVLLDGWAYQDTHETLNTFIWGPDGWLYGCHGVFTHSRVGKPGTPDSERTPLNAAIWRYHPTRRTFEVFAEGTSNPWGVDFDDYGQAFSTACVIPHLYHVVQGGRYQRQAGSHFNPFTYADIQTIADHRHYLGDNPHGGNGRSGDAGGGHAHAGAMIYLGGVWPDEYRGRIFMNNIHGQRLNTDILERRGSGFVGRHGPDFLLTGDIASQILNIRYGPDGNAYFIDWYDTNACHHNNVEGHDRSNGRVFKVAYGQAGAKGVDLSKLSDRELAELVFEKNDWYVRHARRLLQERAAAGRLDREVRRYLREIALTHQDPTRQLRAMWALHVTGGLGRTLGEQLFAAQNEHVRGWAVRLTADSVSHEDDDDKYLTAVEKSAGFEAEAMAPYKALAARETSPVVRLALASAAQRLPVEGRWAILEALTRHAEDAADQNLPLMYWYAAEPLAAVDPERALALGLSCGKTIPLVREFMIRRIASMDEPQALVALAARVAASDDAEEQLTILAGIRRALEGRRRVSPPSNWSAALTKAMASTNDAVRREATALGVTFGDASAMDTMRRVVQSVETESAVRRQALDALLRAKDPQLDATLLKLLAEPALREAALSGLALYDNPEAPGAILRIYSGLPATEQRTALATLASRASYGIKLLEAVAAGQVSAADLPADLVRQLQNHKHEQIDRLLSETWGQVRSTPEDKAKLIHELRELIAKPPERPDLELGRAVFVKTCQQCHVLYGTGATIGPDLTGSNRSDLDYLLSNVVDPSSVIAKDYQQTVIVTIDGLVVSGILKAEDDRSVTIQTSTEVVIIPKEEIEERELSDVSMMPDDQLKQFTPMEVVSLLSYLGGKGQTPVLASKDNQEQFFNGKDLSGWSGNKELWTVEKGEIVGKSPGIDKNEFLFSDLAAEDFELAFEVKLVNDEGNSGVQFRSERLEHGEARGYQADIGPGWWGKLYEEEARALLWDKSGEKHVRKGKWNEYKIRADGSRVRTWINGKPCVDLDDPEGKRRGVFALQIHSGGPMEVRFRNLKLTVLPRRGR